MAAAVVGPGMVSVPTEDLMSAAEAGEKDGLGFDSEAEAADGYSVGDQAGEVHA